MRAIWIGTFVLLGCCAAAAGEVRTVSVSNSSQKLKAVVEIDGEKECHLEPSKPFDINNLNLSDTSNLCTRSVEDGDHTLVVTLEGGKSFSSTFHTPNPTYMFYDVSEAGLKK